MRPPNHALRDPLNGTVRLGALEVALLDTAAFQRLRAVKELNLAHLAFEGATHTCIEHAIGVYHNATEAVARLAARAGCLPWLSDEDATLLTTAALLDDLSHSGIGSHPVEELELEEADHERAAAQLILTGEVADVLAAHWLDAAARDRIARLICKAHRDHPLQPLLSSFFDGDRLGYTHDASTILARSLGRMTNGAPAVAGAPFACVPEMPP